MLVLLPAEMAHKVGWQQIGRLSLYQRLLPGKHRLLSELPVCLLMLQSACEVQKQAFY